MKKLLIAASTFLFSPAFGAYDQDLTRLTQGMPREIHDFIDRRANCNHWRGEYGYDEERRMMIDAALRELRCSMLESDETVLKQRYGAVPNVLKALEETKDWSPG